MLSMHVWYMIIVVGSSEVDYADKKVGPINSSI